MDLLIGIAFKLATVLLFVGLASLSVYWALVRGYKPRTAILVGAMMILVYVGYPFVADFFHGRTDTWVELKQSFDGICQEKSKAMTEEKMSQADIDAILLLLKKYFLECFPAWIITGSFFTGFLAYYLVSSLGSRFTPRIAAPQPFWKWMVPEPLIFGLILGGAVKLTAGDNLRLEIIGNNLLVIFLSIYTFAGLTITSFYFQKWRFGILLRLLAYLLLFELTFNAVCVLGVLDIWLDFRKMKKPSTESAT